MQGDVGIGQQLTKFPDKSRCGGEVLDLVNIGAGQ
jgi:hypothetical protein